MTRERWDEKTTVGTQRLPADPPPSVQGLHKSQKSNRIVTLLNVYDREESEAVRRGGGGGKRLKSEV